MTAQRSEDDRHISRVLEASIHLGLLFSLLAACFFIVRPFAPMIAWGIIIAVALNPAYRRLQRLLGGRGGLAAAICTLLLVAVLMVPVVLMTGSLVDGIHIVTTRVREGTAIIPPPPPRIEGWPLVGPPLKHVWDLAATNLSSAVQTFAPQIKAVLPRVLLASAGIGLAVLQWVASIIVAGFLLASAPSASRLTGLFACRLFGEKGSEFQELATATVRSVATGIIGVAFIQSFFAALGFLFAGLPGAGLWGLIFLLAAIVQLGGIVLIPAVIYMFAIATTGKAAIFLVWCIFVGTMDNLIKPLLLGRGVAVPLAVVFLGTIGGFIVMGTIGLFIGAVILSVGYKLFLAWLEKAPPTIAESPERNAPVRIGA